jgi:hypothetical protein
LALNSLCRCFFDSDFPFYRLLLFFFGSNFLGFFNSFLWLRFSNSFLWLEFGLSFFWFFFLNLWFYFLDLWLSILSSLSTSSGFLSFKRKKEKIIKNSFIY